MKKAITTLALLCMAVFAQQGTFTDSRDSKKYKTVKIGNQTWMAENLNYNASGSKCFRNEDTNCTKYGRLYNWNTAMKACPNGWHLPKRAEWQILINFAGGNEVAMKKLKTKNGWGWDNSCDMGVINGTDEFGFAALPGGYGGGINFSNIGFSGTWWSASESNTIFAEDWNMGACEEYDAGWHGSEKDNLFSVRCLKD